MSSLDTATRTQRAKAILRDMPEKYPGFKLGCTNYLARKMDVRYSEAWDIMDALELSGFISASDGHGRRTLMEWP
jgi:hypothetical protein